MCLESQQLLLHLTNLHAIGVLIICLLLQQKSRLSDIRGVLLLPPVG